MEMLDVAQDYEDSLKAGQEFIKKNWMGLKQETKDSLVDFGSYDNRGRRLKESEIGDKSENLEYQVGILSRCTNYKLPSRSETDVLILKEAYSDEVLYACEFLLYSSQWHDPRFLRLGLNAIRKHQMANLLLQLPPDQKNKFLHIKLFASYGAGILLILIVLLSPGLLGLALVSAAKGDLESTVQALYVMGFGIWIRNLMKNISENMTKVDQDVKSYEAWSWLGLRGGDWLLIGSGAKFSFQEMAKNSVFVPPLAIDLCTVLEANVLKKQ
ncbi:MAG: hypothetical protein LUQ26_05565 [Methylococcaceae bacterium]|nr:hypothetical protein [Methylococcaceae bacterium]